MLIARKTTRRHAAAQFLVCATGCCCGRVDKGKPAVPVAWLKAEWKTRRLNPRVQLTISECLGPCDLMNVVGVLSESVPIWLGGVVEQAHFDSLLTWAEASRDAQKLEPIPELLASLQFNRFPSLLPVSAPSFALPDSISNTLDLEIAT